MFLRSKKPAHIQWIVLALLVFFVAAGSWTSLVIFKTNIFEAGRSRAATVSGSLTGYAWSDMPDGSDQAKSTTQPIGRGMGWISFNCSNESVCATSNYAVSADASGNLSGYAWGGGAWSGGEPLGWISFNAADVAGCPTGTCQAQINQTTGAVTGWARALSLESSDSGGWIHLSGTGYGVAVSGTTWYGYAWGGPVLGWIHFNGTGYGVDGSGTASVPLTPPTLSADPSVLNGAGNTTLHWSSTGASSCTGTNFSTAGATSGTTTVALTQSTNFGVECDGLYASSTASVLVTVETNPVLTLTADQTRVHSGDTTALNWSVTRVASSTCSITGGGWNDPLANGEQDSGTTTTPAITSQTTYTLTCTGTDASTATADVTIELVPVYIEL